MKFKKYIAKGLMLGMIITNLPIYSFANNLKNDFYNEISQIQTKEDLQKSAQKAVKAGEVDAWIAGLTNMSDSRALFASVVVDRKIYVIGGSTSHYVNTVEVYDPVTDKWETKTTMPTYRYGLTSAVVDGKIYCIGGYSGGYSTNKVEVYDPVTDTWETKTSMPTKRESLTSSVIDGKIYVIGGYDYNSSDRYLNKVEVYDPVTDTWETKNPMPTGRKELTSVVIDGKIYCIGGYNDYYGTLNTVEVYNQETDSWETKNPMPTARSGLTSAVVDGKIYCIGGYNGLTYFNKLEVYIAKASPEQEAKDAVDEAEQTKEFIDIETARDLVNQLEESELKNELQDRLDAIIPNLTLDRKNTTANLDIYIKSENMLLMNLSTNQITFEDFSGVEDIEKVNSVNISINSSLPYQLNAYLIDEMYNSDKSKKIDTNRLNIKENEDADYKEFTALNDKLILKDSCEAGNDKKHNIDLKLKGGNAYEADIYKTVIKFEAEQK